MTSRRLPGMGALFLVSLATVGYEIALTRYFAVAKWSEYGYWVISIVLAGFAFSGVALALARDACVRHAEALLAWLPPALIAAAALGFRLVTTNPFNPLQLQNEATLAPQLLNIGLYYACLLPFFFLAGLYISLFFVLHDRHVGRVYGFDLTGAGAGALAALGLMTLVHPFLLVPCLLVPLGLAALSVPRRAPLAATLVLLAGAEALLIGDNQAQYNDYKAIYAPLHVPDSRTVAEIRSPRGYYELLDDFTERVDTDISNNAGMLGLPGPPLALGLYRDGNRLAALPRPGAGPGAVDGRYAGATLAALPYALRPKARVLLVGSSGGFRVAEAEALGARAITVLEPEPVVRAALLHGLGPSPPLAAAVPGGMRVIAGSPLAAAAAGKPFDIIDFAADFLDADEANASAFATEAIAAYLRDLGPDGLLSLPVSIREFPAYAVRLLATVRAALRAAGVADPARHVLVVRSAWNVRLVVSSAPFAAAAIARARNFADERSFDVSYYPGIDVAAARANIYNDLPAVSFTEGAVTEDGGAHDAIADDADALMKGRTTETARAFDLSPITFDRPAFYAVLRLTHPGVLLSRLELLPQQEIGPLVNLAVLAQAVVIALAVLAVPAVGGRRLRGAGGVLRPVVYFPALGLGFLFLEIFLIDRASFYLNERTSGFALVLTGMLVFSGLGSLLGDRLAAPPRRVLAVAVGVILAWGLVLLFALQPAMLATLGLPWIARAALVLLAVAPASMALGLPFPLGLGRMGPGGFLPWAWGLNGAFSVVATPLANLMALGLGYDRVLIAALLLYVTCLIAFPHQRRT